MLPRHAEVHQAAVGALIGSLVSNGRVFLINPNGVVFGANAFVDTAGFIASSLGITDRDFLEGKLREFDLELDLRATAFQRKVYDGLLAIPYGETCSYAELAREIQERRPGRR